MPMVGMVFYRKLQKLTDDVELDEFLFSYFRHLILLADIEVVTIPFIKPLAELAGMISKDC